MNRLTRYHALAFMVLCLLVAAALRLPELTAVPPGLHYDEAANAILAGEIGRGERFPIFISSYTGKEALFFYLAAAVMRLTGETVFALRLTAAFIALLTIAATYWLGREMLADRRVAILAAALLAVSFWHLVFSRLGFRVISEPLLQALTAAALFRGLRRNQTRWFLIGGIFLGLTAYTYLAARLFPLLLLIAALPLLLSRATRRQRLRQLAVYGATAVVVLLPLLAYFYTHPDAFWVRITQVAPGAQALSLQESFSRAFGMFFLRGDPFLRFNLPGLPLFSWFWGGLLIVGWLIAAWRLRRFPYDWQRAAILLLVAAPLVMILPTALATAEIVPSNLRALGMIPFIFYLPAIGVVILLHDLDRRFHFPPVTFAVLFIGLLVLLSGGLATYQRYFTQWAREPALYYEADGDLTAVAAFLDARDLTDTSVYVAAPHYKHPTLAFLSASYGRVKWLPDSHALVFPPEGSALVVYPHNSPAPAWAAPYLAGAQQIAPARGTRPDAYTAYLLSATPPIDPPVAVNADFGGVVTLLGYGLDPVADGSLPLTLFWRVDSPPPAGYAPFAQLEDAWGTRWSQAETFAYPAEQWTPGEIIVQRVDVPVPPGTPPGSYRLRVGLYDAASDTRLPRLDAAGSYAGDAYFVEEVAIPPGGLPDARPAPPFAIDERVLPGLRLLGYARGGPTAVTGESYGVSLWWQAQTTPPALTTRFELLGPDNTGRILLNTQPVHDTYPFASWEAPLFLIDPQGLPIPDDLPGGDYRLGVRILDAADATLLTADLGPLRVEATERRFTPPAVSDPLDAVFGGEIALLGYDLAPQPDGTAVLTLVWQALQAPTADYTVFVHVLNADGSCCAWQQDAMPQQNAYPTSRWLPGEVVVDSYTLGPLPPGTYPLELGLYLAETGQRLQLTATGQPAADVLFLPPLQVPGN